ncbi:MAG: hypothetical protein ACYDBH_02960 [Acidobacteriaceae bacterium]
MTRTQAAALQTRRCVAQHALAIAWLAQDALASGLITPEQSTHAGAAAAGILSAITNGTGNPESVQQSSRVLVRIGNSMASGKIPSASQTVLLTQIAAEVWLALTHAAEDDGVPL